MSAPRKSRAKPPHAPGNLVDPRQGTAALVPMLDTNLALCLASGLLGPRFEAAAARDQHAIAGHLVLVEHPVASDIAQARGDVKYGSVVLVELDTDKLLGAGGALESAPQILPLSFVRRVVFATEEKKSDFAARNSAYGDIPSGLVPLVVDAALFPEDVPGEASSTDPHTVANAAPTPPSEMAKAVVASTPVANAGDLPASTMRTTDAIAGGLRAFFAAVTVVGREEDIVAAGTLRFDESTQVDGSALLGAFASALDPEEKDPWYRHLATLAANVLDKWRVQEGIDAGLLLDDIEELANFSSLPQGASARAFFDYARKAVDASSPIPPNAYEDAGSIVPRGLLLFLLNPAPDRLGAIPKRIQRLGPRVYAFACALSGYRAGMARLPALVKATPPESLLATAELAWQLCGRESARLDVSRKWSADGSQVVRLLYGARELARVVTPASPMVSGLLAAISKAGFEAAIGSTDGAISLDVHAAGDAQPIFVTVDLGPMIPRASSYRFAVLGPAMGTPRKAVAEAARWNAIVEARGVFARPVCSGKVGRVEWAVYSRIPASPADIEEAAKMLRAAHDESMAAAEKPPVEGSLFPGAEGTAPDEVPSDADGK